MKKGTLHANKVPQILLTRIRHGYRKTREEWGKEFGKTTEEIARILTGLRKKGYMLYPVGGVGKQPGIVLEVTKRMKDYRSTVERVSKGFINPHIQGGFRLHEQYLIENPGQRAEIELTASEFVRMVEGYKRHLLQAIQKWNGTLPTQMIPGSTVPFINVAAPTH